MAHSPTTIVMLIVMKVFVLYSMFIFIDVLIFDTKINIYNNVVIIKIIFVEFLAKVFSFGDREIMYIKSTIIPLTKIKINKKVVQ